MCLGYLTRSCWSCFLGVGWEKVFSQQNQGSNPFRQIPRGWLIYLICINEYSFTHRIVYLYTCIYVWLNLVYTHLEGNWRKDVWAQTNLPRVVLNLLKLGDSEYLMDWPCNQFVSTSRIGHFCCGIVQCLCWRPSPLTWNFAWKLFYICECVIVTVFHTSHKSMLCHTHI